MVRFPTKVALEGGQHEPMIGNQVGTIHFPGYRCFALPIWNEKRNLCRCHSSFTSDLCQISMLRMVPSREVWLSCWNVTAQRPDNPKRIQTVTMLPKRCMCWYTLKGEVGTDIMFYHEEAKIYYSLQLIDTQYTERLLSDLEGMSPNQSLSYWS